MFNQVLADAIQRVLSKTDARFICNSSLQRLVDDYQIGTKRGNSVYFTDKDRVEMRKLLKAKGYSENITNIAGLSRNQRLSVTPNEKAGREAIKKDRISIKALHGKILQISSDDLILPNESHLDVSWPVIVKNLKHNCIIVVENYENFNYIHQITFNLPDEFQSPLVVYRGDPGESRFDYVLSFLKAVNKPVLAFTDLDPAGITIACALPNLLGIIAPNLSILENYLTEPAKNQQLLFYDQYPIYGVALNHLSEDHPCYSAWKLISKYKTGTVQEHWINGPSCTLIT